MDVYFAFPGVIANLGLTMILFLGFANINSLLITLAALALIAAATLGSLGLVRKGSIGADASGVILLGNFPVWVLNLWLLWGASMGYQESLPFCQVGLSYAPPRCAQGSDDLAIAGMLVASLVVTAMVSIANLLNLRRLSRK